jgi:hypothetical protein
MTNALAMLSSITPNAAPNSFGGAVGLPSAASAPKS